MLKVVSIINFRKGQIQSSKQKFYIFVHTAKFAQTRTQLHKLALRCMWTYIYIYIRKFYIKIAMNFKF